MRGETAEESVDALVAPARAFEEGREFVKAIDAYLAVTAVRCKEHDVLEAVWENAVKLAMNHVPERIGEVVGIVTKRLVEINRHAQAAQIYATCLSPLYAYSRVRTCSLTRCRRPSSTRLTLAPTLAPNPNPNPNPHPHPDPKPQPHPQPQPQP